MILTVAFGKGGRAFRDLLQRLGHHTAQQEHIDEQRGADQNDQRQQAVHQKAVLFR